jgi:hypothetical protein
MIFNLNKKIIACIMIMMFLINTNITFADMFSPIVTDIPHTVTTGTNTAQQSINTSQVVKDAIKNLFKEIAKGVAKTLLNKLTESTVNWINGGFDGGPSFVTHPDAFFKDVADTQITTYIDSIAYNEKKFPLGQNTSKALIKNYIYGQDSFAEKSKYTFNTVGQELTGKGVDEVSGFGRQFERDFKVAGSKGLEAQTQNPYNNPFGNFVKSVKTTDKAKQRALERQQKELEQGGGFLSQKKCIKYDEGPKLGEAEKKAAGSLGSGTFGQGVGLQTNLSSGGSLSSGNFGQGVGLQTNMGAPKKCLQWETKTPGAIAGGQINRALSSKFFQSELGGAIGGSISQIVNALTSQLVNKGLTALATVAKDAWAPKNQGWTYDGLSIAGPDNETSTNNPSNWANMPDRVIDLQELLIDGVPLVTEVTVDANGDEVITVIERGPTVIELTKQEADTYDEMRKIVENFPTKLHALDRCDVGPDRYWERKVTETFQRATRKLQSKANAKNQDKATNAQNALDKLEGEEGRLVRNIRLKTLDYNLPGHAAYQDQINLTNRYSQNLKQYYDKLLAKKMTLAQLINIRDSFQNPNSLNSKVELIGRYANIEAEVANIQSLANAKSELSKIQLEDRNIGDMDNPLIQGDQSTGLIRRCNNERSAAANDPNLRFIDPGTNTPMNVASNDEVVNEAETGPDGAQNIPIISNVNRTDMIQYISTNFALTNTTKLKVGSTDLEDLVIVYSILKDPASQGSICPGLTGDALVTCSLEYVDANIIDYGKRAIRIDSEIYYYCYSEIQKLNLTDVYKRKDIEIDCKSFYESSPIDYEINKDY